MDDFNSLSNRLLNQCPAAGIFLARQFINDSWHELQARREWSWRRRSSGVFTPSSVYAVGTCSTNVGVGSPTLITGSGTTWTAAMVGTQIRVGGYLYPYYTITAVNSSTSLSIDSPWAGPDVSAQTYQILQCYFPVPSDFGYFEVILSPKDGYRINTTLTQMDLALRDPQRTNQGQTYCAVFRDYTQQYGGFVSAMIPVGATGAIPTSGLNSSTGYTYVSSASYIIQVVGGGISGTATYQWMRVGQAGFTGPVTTNWAPQDLMDGVQVAWPQSVNYVANDLFIINAAANISSGVPRYELWPAPTYTSYLYPYIYIAREYDLTDSAPSLPYTIAYRGESLLEMALAKCSRFPGTDADHPNPYFSPVTALQHDTRAERLLDELEKNDEEIGVTRLDYDSYPFYPAPWLDASWQQTHAPFM